MPGNSHHGRWKNPVEVDAKQPGEPGCLIDAYW